MKQGRILPLGGAVPGHTMGEVVDMLSETQLLNHIYPPLFLTPLFVYISRDI